MYHDQVGFISDVKSWFHTGIKIKQCTLRNYSEIAYKYSAVTWEVFNKINIYDFYNLSQVEIERNFYSTLHCRFFWLAHYSMWDLAPSTRDQTPHPLWLKHRVLITGWPGKSLHGSS